MQNFSHLVQDEHFQIGDWMKGVKHTNGKPAIS